MMATSTFPPETSLPPPALHQPPPPDISQAGSVLDPPKAVIYNKDGTQCMHIVKKESLDVPGNQCQSQNSECSAAKKVSAILSDPPIGSRKKKKKKSKRKGGATSLSQMLPPEYDDDDEDAEFYQEIVQPLPPPPPPLHSTKSSRTPPFASTKAPCITKSKENFEDCKSGAAGTDAKRKKKKKKKTSTAEPISQLANSRNDRTASANEATAGKVVPSANRAQSKTTPSHPTNAQTNGRSMLSSDDGFWQDKNCEERAKIREFWLQMGEIERRELVQVEKEAVLRKMKEQQKQSCSCAICGRKRNAIEEELEVLYDAYYEELETYANQHQNQLLPPSAQYRANAGSPPLPSSDVSPFGPPLTHPASQQHQHHRRNLNAPPHEVIRSQHCQLHSQPGHVHDTISDDDFEGSDYEDEEGEDDEDEDEDEEEEEEDEDDEEEDDDEECEGELSYDDEEEEEDASDATRLGRRNTPLKNSPNLTHHPSSNGGGNGGGSYFNFGNSLTVKGGILTVADDLLKNDSEKFLEMMERLAERRMRRDEEIAMEQEALAAGNGPNGATYQDEYDDEEEEEEDDDEEFEDEAEEDSMTEEQRLEEGRRMFQLFAARMFEQRVLTAYREKVAQERQQRLLDELEEETRLKQEREDAKNKMKEKKKDKKRALRQQKEEERLAREAARLAEETAQRVERERRADAERKRKEEERLRSEKERKQKDEERARKEEEKRRKTKQREHKERQEREVKEKEREEKERREKEERQEQAAKEERERERKAQEEKEQQEKEDLEKGFTPVARSDRRRSSASDRHQHLMQQAQAAAQTQPRAPHPLPLPPPLSQRLPPSIPRSAVSSVRDAHHHGLPPPPPKNVHMHHRERKRDQPSPSTAAPATSLAPSLISPAVSASASLFAHSPTSTNLQLNAPPNQGSRPAPPGGQSNPLASPTYQSQRPSVSSIAQQPSSQTAVASSSANVSQSLFSDPTSSRQGTKSSPQVSPVPIASNSKRPASANGNSAPGPIGRPPLVTGTGATLGGNLCNGTTGGLSLSASPTRGLFLGGGQGLGVNVTDGRPVSPPRANSIPQGGSLFRGGDPIRPPTSKAIVRPAPIGRPRGSTVGFEATGTSSSPTKGLDMFDPPTSPPPTGPPGFAMYGRSRESTSPTPPSDQAPASTIPGGSNFTVPTIPCTSAVGSTAIPSSSASAATATGSLFSSPSFFSGPPAPLLHHDHDHDLAHPHHPLYHTTPHSLGPPPSQDISMHLPHSFLPSFLSHPGMQFLPPQAQVPLPQSQSQSQSAAAAVPPPPPPAQQSQPQPLPPSHDASQRAPHSHPQGLGHNLSIAPSPFVSSTAGLWGPVGGFGIGMGLMRGAGGGGGFLGGVGTIQGEGMNSMMQQGGSNSVTGVGAVGESRRSSGMGFEKTVWH